MAIVTLCPQCQTAFAIQAEHYSAADAWVRCGRCAHVYKVDQHLFEWDEPPPPPTPSPVYKPAVARPRTKPVRQESDTSVFLWYLLTGLLALILGFQFFLHQRDQIRGTIPELTPIFASVCHVLSCDLNWPMKPDKLSIESGSFKHMGGNDYAFAGVIKNQSDVYLQTPSLELSLTDDIDMPVVRKVITPEDMRLPSPLRGYRAQSFEVKFSLDPETSSKINGYRAFLFYP